MNVTDISTPVAGRPARITTTFLTEPEMLSVFGQDLGPPVPITAKTISQDDTYRFDRDHFDKFRHLVVGFFKDAAMGRRHVLDAPLEAKGTPDQPERYLRPLVDGKMLSRQNAAEAATFFLRIPNPLPVDTLVFLPPDMPSRDKIADTLIPFRKLFAQVIETDATVVAVRISLQPTQARQLILQ